MAASIFSLSGRPFTTHYRGKPGDTNIRGRQRSCYQVKFILLTAAVISLYLPASGSTIDSLEFGRFGMIHFYRPTTPPVRVALFLSGDGGWNLGVLDMA